MQGSHRIEYMEGFVTWIAGVLAGIPKELVIFVTSLLPVLELRGGMIAATLLGVPYLNALLICILGNVIPVPFILWLITPVFTWLKKTKLFKGIVEKLENKAMSKSDRVQKAEFWGLLLFVGIPLPGTGAWTGTMIAALLGLKPKKAVPAILLGVLLAAAIMSFVTYGIPWMVTNLF